MNNLEQWLEPIAEQFRSLGVPSPIVQWGHPAMMAIVIFVMGSFVAWVGWRGRTEADPETASQSLAGHRKLAPWMFLFLAKPARILRFKSLIEARDELRQQPMV
jgi:hypothetical protein